MKKKILMFTLLSIILVMPTCKVDALRTWEITGRNECDGKIELANAKTDGSLEKVSCHDNYDLAKSAMNSDSREDLVIIENGVIIDAKYAVVDYEQNLNPSKKYIDVYTSSTSWDTEGRYIKTANQPDDAVVLDYDYNTKRIKIKVSGLIGWISKTDNGYINYDVVPVAWAKTPQYYSVNNNSITHVFPGNVYGDKGEYSISIDTKPSMLNTGKYYSYDGHYFYTDMKTLIRDYKAETYTNSVNSKQPYYNFYQYMSFRTKTVYTADNINDYLHDRTSKEKSHLHPNLSKYSDYDTSKETFDPGTIFIKYQNLYGTNALLMLSIATNESNWAQSLIAENNIFGLNAYDSNPGGSASSYSSIEDCVRQFSYYWLSFGFLQPGDGGGSLQKTRFRGSNVGNKGEGLNYKYASDPFWGEKAAAYYYQLDKYFDFQEKKQSTYTIAVLNNTYTNGIYAKKTPNGSNVSGYYKYVNIDSPVVVLGEEKDSNGETWYKIQSDGTLDANRNYVNNSTDNEGNNKYLWDTSYVYVSSKNFRKVTDEVTEYPSNQPINNENENNNNQEPSTPKLDPVTTIVTKASYRVEGRLLSSINLNTEASTVINNLKAKGASSVVVTNANGQAKSGRLATGDKITIVGATTETYEIVIAGDTDGDGTMSAMDYVNIKNHIMESHSLGGAYLKAADVDRDGSVSAVDYVSVKNYIMNQ